LDAHDLRGCLIEARKELLRCVLEDAPGFVQLYQIPDVSCHLFQSHLLALSDNALLIRALLKYYLYYGDNFRIECPTGSGNSMNLFQVAREVTDRLICIFLRDQAGRRPVFGGAEKFQSDPYWRDHLLFYEYFHGANGAGIGASHQTG
jgi:hypothetical protein